MLHVFYVSSSASAVDDETITVEWAQTDGYQLEDSQIVVVMVGLPARGKSLIAQKSTSLVSVQSNPADGC
jgi:hypothetical protein